MTTGDLPTALNKRIINMWLTHREDKPVLTVHCDAVKACGRPVAYIWATPNGLLLQAFSNVAPQKSGIVGEGLTQQQLDDHIGTRDDMKHTPGSDTVIRGGLQDEAGYLAIVDSDDYWAPHGAGCVRHGTLRQLERQPLLDAVAAGRTDVGLMDVSSAVL